MFFPIIAKFIFVLVVFGQAALASPVIPPGLTWAQYDALHAASFGRSPSLESLSLPFLDLGVQEHTLLIGKDEFWPAFLRDVETTRQPIRIQVFGWTPDAFTEDFVKLLGRKVASGVPVQLLLDAKGARASFPGSVGQRLRRLAESLGIQVQVTRDIRLTSGPHFDHRKIYIVGENAYLTGFTFEEEMHSQKFDVGLRVTGELRNQLLWAYAMSWFYFGNSPSLSFGELERSWSVAGVSPWIESKDKSKEWTLVQNIPGGERRITKTLLERLDTAMDSILLINPYFGDREVWSAVLRARKRGATVTVVAPRIPEHPMYGKQFAADALQLSASGIDVRYYDGPENFGRLHGKVVFIDDDFAQFGSANLDPLSLRRNFEIVLQSRNRSWNREFKSRVLGNVMTYSHQWKGPSTEEDRQQIRKSAVCSSMLRSVLEWSVPIGK